MDIACTGSVAYDYLMSFPGYFIEHILTERLGSLSLSFLVDSLVIQHGGTAPNIAYTLALLGERPRLVATVGEDFEEYRAWLESKGVDTSNVKVIRGEHTASFFANTDKSNSQIASFYSGAMAHAAEISIGELSGGRPDLVMISPNDPGAMVKYANECREMSVPYFYDPSQQIVRMEAEDIRRGVDGAKALFLNEYEYELLQVRTGLSEAQILKESEFMVVTLGEKGARIYTRDKQIEVPAVTPHKMVEPTGVGDAFRGGFLCGYARGWDMLTSARMGALAATYCLEERGPQNHSYTPGEFVTRFRQHFDDGGLLDALIH
jgi:adenosine kinase